jgi:hypothetical protein
MKTKLSPSKRLIKDIVTLCKRIYCKWLLEKLNVSDTVPPMKKPSKSSMKMSGKKPSGKSKLTKTGAMKISKKY